MKKMFLMLVCAMVIATTLPSCNGGGRSRDYDDEDDYEQVDDDDFGHHKKKKKKKKKHYDEDEDEDEGRDTVVIVKEVIKQVPTQPAPAPAPAPTYSHGTNANNPYSWACYREVTYNDIAGLSKAQLRLLRNGIYAQHDYAFKSADLQRHFGQFSWYSPRFSNVENQLSSLERRNIQYIKQFE